ncbi:YhgE/Pip-like protein [Desulfosporosinus orientis DSM 765]|uniref:YhgE/Pip-like protein n=1 Tax=Desulfosporosinus orientis (strain ATCC 19365 / DSM 765 / NCIMB 8382 / VKM B-1628 / Singapore I) TaxID=768706 RepID=G7WF12_DESOD|nr:YhgE/Pip domain-containing protein [Desulfosporosinus orientis]AET67623.1 YhgE/Pip-like protein [Desulfosporosinus orientis DSM 765]
MDFHKILDVYRRDWKRIVTNPVALIIIGGLCLIPSLYAWINIKASWDIYENTGDIPVAVVNNDKAVSFHGKEINIGNDVVAGLQENNKIHWIFVSRKEADLGLIDSTYYAAIEIPEDFSQKFLTILSDNPQKPQIIYKADTKVNPVAGKIVGTAKNALVQEITANFLTTVNETLFSSLNTVGKDAEKNRDKILDLKDSIVKVNQGMTVITNSLAAIHTNSDNLSQLLDSVDTALPLIQSGLETVALNNSHRSQAIQSLKAATNESLTNINTNLNYIKASNDRIAGLFTDLNEAAAEGNKVKINTLFPKINAGLDAMDSAIEATKDYLQSCKELDVTGDIDRAVSDLTSLQTSILKVRQQLVTVQEHLAAVKTKTDQAYEALNLDSLQDSLNSLNDSLGKAIVRLQSLNLPELDPLISALQEMQAKLNNGLIPLLKTIADSQESVDEVLESLDQALTKSIQTLDKVNTQINTALDFLKVAKADNRKKQEILSDMIDSLAKMQPYLADEKVQFSNLQEQINKGNQISKSSADMINQDLQKISQQLTAAITDYNNGAKEALGDMADGLFASAAEATQMIQSAQDLSKQIAAMVHTAQSGVKLASGLSADLNTRLQEFKDIINLLSGKLQVVNNRDIAQIIALLQTNPALMGSLMADPFDLRTESINAIPNYGSSMAPIYTTLALWVGCLILNSILKPRVASFPGSETLTLRERHFGKMLLFISLAVIQGLIAALGDLYLLHIYTVNKGLFITFCLVSSLVFSIITFTLMSTLGNLGKALAIIYMILQLAGSGGTYPIQVDPLIFRILQPLFPFTYAVNGLREAVAGPLVSSVVLDFIQLFLFAVVFLLFGYFAIKPLHKYIHRFEEKFNESGIGE